ncbi:MAG: glycosyltransferase [Verrucomicrobia bacterium]|nr:glycosyltransferase [Verrucomicrobiota bacterium]
MSSPPQPLLRWTRFASDPHGTGPEKRTAQITGLITAAGLAAKTMRPPASFPRWRAWLAGVQARARFGACAGVDRAGIGLLGYRTLFYRDAIARHRGARVLLWETTYDTLLPAMARAAGFRLVAVPHNLEALVSEQVFADPAYDPTEDLGAEVRRLALADAVFTIAKEERWFLEARGLAPDYLPYFPDPVLARECAAVRARRVARVDARGEISGPLLVLGAAFNPATARGMQVQLSWLAELGPTAPSVIVAGPQTDTLLASFRSPRVELLGRVSRERLVELLVACSAMLIDTSGGAGAVTRIPEALLSGVPLIANPNAARDQHGTAGVAEYTTPAEFHALCRGPHALPPAPPAPAAAAARFQARLQALVGCAT